MSVYQYLSCLQENVSYHCSCPCPLVLLIIIKTRRYIRFNKQQKSEWKHKTAFRSSRLEVFCRKVVLRNFAKFKGKHLCQSVRPATLLKWDSGTGVFLWILRNFRSIMFPFRDRHRILLLTLNDPCISENCIEKKKVKFLFSHFFVVPQKVLRYHKEVCENKHLT